MTEATAGGQAPTPGTVYVYVPHASASGLKIAECAVPLKVHAPVTSGVPPRVSRSFEAVDALGPKEAPLPC